MASGDFGAGLGGFLQGFSRAAERGITLNTEAQLAQQRESRLAELQKSQMGLNLIQGFRQLMDVPPNLAGPMFESFAKSLGVDVTNDNFKLLSKTFGKLDPEQREVFKSYLATVGAQNPDQILDFVTQLTRNPATMMELFGQVAQFQQGQVMQNLLGGAEAQSGLPQIGGASQGPGGGIQEQTIGPQEPVMQPPDPVAQMEATIAEFERRRQAIIQAPGNMKAKEPFLKEADKIIDNARQRLGQLQALRQQQTPGKELQDVLRSQGIDPLRAIPKQIAQARQQLFQEKIDISAAQGSAATTAKTLAEGRLPVEPSAGERKELVQREAAIEELDRLEQSFDDSFVGPIRGRVLGGTETAFGLVTIPGKIQTGIELTDQEAEFVAITRSVQNRIIREITGAQLSEPEADRIMGQIPSLTDPPKLWKAKFKQTKINLNRLLDIQQRRLRQPRKAESRKAPSPQDIDKALNDAGGDAQKAAQLLFNQGFDLTAEVQ